VIIWAFPNQSWASPFWRWALQYQTWSGKKSQCSQNQFVTQFTRGNYQIADFLEFSSVLSSWLCTARATWLSRKFHLFIFWCFAGRVTALACTCECAVPFACAPWLILHVCHDSFYMCAMTHSHTSHDLFTHFQSASFFNFFTWRVY
jgi:hypothetical protein